MSSITQRIEQGEQLLHEIKEGAFSATSPEQLDTKQVFEATKHSLQDLKQAIANQPDLQKKKEQEKAVLVYVQHLLGLSSLETTDKTTLQHIQQHLESNQILLDVQFEQIEQVVSNLETKIENLTASDQEKIKALQKTVDQQKRSLQSLKQGVSESVDEARKKAFEALKTELEKHRYSKWLAGPVYTFLVDKYINKKQMSKFSLWLGGIGVAVASWFLPKTIKNLIGNIDHMSVDEISNLVQSGKEKAEVVADLTLEKAKELQEEINPKLRAFFEKKFGKKFDEEKWKQVFSGWREQWKGHLGLKDLVHNVETKQDIDIIDEAFSLVTAP
ncbi:MAG: hypothetical protein LBU27_02480 [Candidatus Peribacteria bacterium]|jgi:hypothetical protein|nr:hypothetical protein [Candidatus Peribacteria bacterium]